MPNKISKKDIKFYIKIVLEESLFEKRQLDIFQNILLDKLTVWSESIKILPTENSPCIGFLEEHNTLFEAIHEICPLSKYGLGNAILHGSYKGIYFYLYNSRDLFTPNNNLISIEILKILEIEGQDIREWIVDFFTEIITLLPVRYGRACLDSEFRSKNYIEPSFKGVNLYESLPGLYWLNYLGIPYIKMIGEEKIIHSGAYSINQYNGGVLLGLDENPFNWNTEEYQDCEQQVLEKIGCQYFFMKNKPDQVTVTPDFATEYQDRVKL